MSRLFRATPANDLPHTPNYNICPTNRIHAVTSRDGARHLGAMRWGFIPHWYKRADDGPLLFNARAETLADKPAFRDACRQRRCLIPADGFYEWRKDDAGDRLPWFIRRRDEQPMVFAGIWQVWQAPDAPAEPITSCAIVTCQANGTIAAVHHRMPVILPPDDWPLWLGEAGYGAATLMRPAPEDALDLWRVDARVNSNRAEGPELIDPIGMPGA